MSEDIKNILRLISHIIILFILIIILIVESYGLLKLLIELFSKIS